MHKENFIGNHYNIGYYWGKILKENNANILSTIPFPIKEQHIEFAKNCESIYKTHFPEILEEIQGIADGQGIDVSLLKALLFSMYCIMPNTNCSCFATKTKDDNILMGRNSDFLTMIEEFYMTTTYEFSSDSFSFWANTTAFVQMEDGINEHGLAIGLTSVKPMGIRPGINSGMLLRLFLEKCKTVRDVISLINQIPRATSQTFVATDKTGQGALIEASIDKIDVKEINTQNNFVCSTNMFNLPAMKSLNNLPKDNWFAKERYKTMYDFLSTNVMDLEKSKELLSGKHGFICQYDRNTGKDTVWSVIYDSIGGNINFVDGNPSAKEYSLIQFPSLKKEQ